MIRKFGYLAKFRCLSTINFRQNEHTNARTLQTTKQNRWAASKNRRDNADGQDWYAILGLPKNTSTKSIKKAYYELAKQFHPDTNLNNVLAAKKFREITEAYEILSDENARREYDLKGTVNPRLNHSNLKQYMNDSDELLKRVFKKVDSSHAEFELSEISEIPDEIPLTISLTESIEGTVKELHLPIKINCEKCRHNITPVNRFDGACKACNGTGVQSIKSESAEIKIQCKFCKGTKIGFSNLCSDCDGKGYVFQRRKITVNIPTMAEDGQLVNVKHPTRKRDLVVRLSVDRHSEFERSGFDLHSKIDISFTQSILGGATTVQGLREQLYVEIPPGSQPDTTVTLTGKGIRKFNSNKCGDHVVHLKVKLPKKLSAKQRQLIEQFAETEGGEVFRQQTKTDRLKDALKKKHQNQQHEQY